jgi:hypothetical protein
VKERRKRTVVVVVVVVGDDEFSVSKNELRRIKKKSLRSRDYMFCWDSKDSFFFVFFLPSDSDLFKINSV